jgi:hypothetical protein
MLLQCGRVPSQHEIAWVWKSLRSKPPLGGYRRSVGLASSKCLSAPPPMECAPSRSPRSTKRQRCLDQLERRRWPRTDPLRRERDYRGTGNSLRHCCARCCSVRCAAESAVGRSTRSIRTYKQARIVDGAGTAGGSSIPWTLPISGRWYLYRASPADPICDGVGRLWIHGCWCRRQRGRR